MRITHQDIGSTQLPEMKALGRNRVGMSTVMTQMADGDIDMDLTMIFFWKTGIRGHCLVR